MKKIFAFAAAALVLASCGGNGKTESGENSAKDETAFYEAQPLESGEYRVVSYQYGDLLTDRVRFDGRMLLAMAPDNSGIYIYENGNRTNFKASLVLPAGFEKRDSLYEAKDTKQGAVTLIPAEENDTLVFDKGGKTVKVAFEKKAISTLTPKAAWERITSKLQ